MKKNLSFLTLPLLLLGCDSVKDSLGLTHYQADEFNIPQGEPLTLPPNYDLIPPRKKDKDGNSVPIHESAVKAKEILGGEGETSLSSESQEALKENTGQADDSIREQVNAEAETEETPVANKLENWKKEFIKNAKSINSDTDTDSVKSKSPKVSPGKEERL